METFSDRCWPLAEVPVGSCRSLTVRVPRGPEGLHSGTPSFLRDTCSLLSSGEEKGRKHLVTGRLIPADGRVSSTQEAREPGLAAESASRSVAGGSAAHPAAPG